MSGSARSLFFIKMSIIRVTDEEGLKKNGKQRTETRARMGRFCGLIRFLVSVFCNLVLYSVL